MAEPISKKSGAYFRKTRARKIELEKIELNKMKPLSNFFKPTQTEQSSISNESGIVSNNYLKLEPQIDVENDPIDLETKLALTKVVLISTEIQSVSIDTKN
ncbi:hypothetical protein Bhyg_04087 [Pseudolycoriella hygida]|uniref:Uncharacterized protein n=1 Tax=Pseudolycoriella hygida TaxID=35572 RepID=A0A9Q0NEL6_9DIPT|nr:hypothetical protein Bhyg_04087 [Pseudolycoriella hygida]